MHFFEVTGDDVANLNDPDLRTLVVRLCRAELQRFAHPVSSVTAGGAQDAPDGGIDVRVDLPGGTHALDFIPRAKTGFQVKKHDMGPAIIKGEMRPNNVLRPAIAALAQEAGAYVIVCSSGSVADAPLQARIRSMYDCVEDVPQGNSLLMDFYDRTRLAGWINSYPGVALWVRGQVGRTMRGWQPYANWSAPQESTEAEFIQDDASRIFDLRNSKEEELPVVQGINRLREILSIPHGVIRLIGLSGMGKTRFVQALFDERLGNAPLPTSLVAYTDIGHEPEPSPLDVIHSFSQAGQRAIVTVDNCNPETHAMLSQACRAEDSTVSLLTVEYDVRDDVPEGTEVFKLSGASVEVTERLIRQRMQHVTEPDARRIAALADGNARIALSLASTVDRGESISGLSDRALFKRLFHQGHAESEELEWAAAVCALVYSFDVETLEGQGAELPLLAELAGQNTNQLYRYVGELKQRELVQQRGRWRAVLPHALAHYLAKHALERIPCQQLQKCFEGQASIRLLQSFSRRLGYLHDSPVAKAIVAEWLQSGGLLHDMGQLSDEGVDMLCNIAPVDQQAFIEAVARAQDNGSFWTSHALRYGGSSKLFRVLVRVAHEEQYFEVATSLMVHFLVEQINEKLHGIRKDPFVRLFHIAISGTTAPVQLRIKVVDSLLQSEQKEIVSLGYDALTAMFKSSHFMGSSDYAFGARPRGYGWLPRTREDRRSWYEAVFEYATRISVGGSLHRERVKSIIASHFRDLWHKSAASDLLDKMVRTLADEDFWPECWLEVCKTLHLDAESMEKNEAERLYALEEALSPNSLKEKALVFINTESWKLRAYGSEAAELQSSTENRILIESQAEELGAQIAQRTEVLAELVPFLCSARHNGMMRQLGSGLAEGAQDMEGLWEQIVADLRQCHAEDKNYTVLQGMLSKAIHICPDTANNLLDQAVEDATLGAIFPLLQCAVPIDARGLERLHDSIGKGMVTAHAFDWLSLGRVTDSIPQDELCKLLEAIGTLREGWQVAANIMCMKLDLLAETNVPMEQTLLDFGRRLLLLYPLEELDQMEAFYLERILKTCVKGESGNEFASEFGKKMTTFFQETYASPYQYGKILTALFNEHPEVVLDAFVGELSQDEKVWHIKDLLEVHPGLLASIPFERLKTWADVAPNTRYPQLASVIPLFSGEAVEGEEKLSPLAHALILAAPEKEPVLAQYERWASPQSWTGSLSEILDARAVLLCEICNHPDAGIANWAVTMKQKLVELAASRRDEFMEDAGSFE